MDFVSIDIWTIIFQWCNLIILYLLMKKFLFGRVKKVLDKRSEQILKLYSDAHEAQEKADGMKAEYSKKLEGAREQAREIAETAALKARRDSEEMINEARESARGIVARGEERAERERAKAMEQVKTDLSDIAVTIAGKIIEKDIKKEDHEEMIKKIIEEMGEAS